MRRAAEHVILISVDGFRPEFAMQERWPAPTLQQLCWEGATAHAVRGVFPSLTYPAHTTLVTGALPARHGVYFNEPFDVAGQTGAWDWHASSIRVPALWDAVRSAGGTTASVSWPVTVGADIDWNIPDVWPLSPDVDPMQVIREATTPTELFDEVQREAVGRLRAENFSISRLTREDRVGEIGGYLFERYRPTLMLIHLIGVDHVTHELGLSNPEVRRAVGAADRAIGQILEVIERLDMRERVALIITGDHGEIDSHTSVHPNVLLADARLRENKPDRGVWRATFHGSGGSAFLRVRDAEDRLAIEQVRNLLDALRPGEKKLFRIVEREELDYIGADPAAAFALAGQPGVTFSDSAEGPLVQAAAGGSHGYDPHLPEMNTGFVAAGAGIHRGAIVPLLPLENIAPVVADLLKLDFVAPDGVLYPGILSEYS